jgi:catechol 2,3-dioxygenase-like lactoylglutathione lyase family enzyme
MLASIPLRPALPASDLERARAWYRDKLGIVPEHEDMGGLWYRTGGQSFNVFLTPNAGTARNTAAGWTVIGIESVMADLRARGVVFDEVDMGGGMSTVDGLLEAQGFKAAWFKDSEGNTLELSEVPAGG